MPRLFQVTKKKDLDISMTIVTAVIGALGFLNFIGLLNSEMGWEGEGKGRG